MHHSDGEVREDRAAPHRSPSADRRFAEPAAIAVSATVSASSDAKDGKPHLAHGMVKRFSVK